VTSVQGQGKAMFASRPAAPIMRICRHPRCNRPTTNATLLLSVRMAPWHMNLPLHFLIGSLVR